jgi:DNA-binding HxlR family transcriptional regulator
MPMRSDWSNRPCPIARTLDVVGDAWVLLILRDAMTGLRRFEQFRAQLGVADNVLSRRLQLMVDAGLLRRSAYRGEQRTHHEYLLTEAGAQLLPVLNAMVLWGERFTQAPQENAHMQIVHTTCGGVTTSGEVCSNCGEMLDTGNTAWRREWMETELVTLQKAG